MEIWENIQYLVTIVQIDCRITDSWKSEDFLKLGVAIEKREVH